MDYYSSKYNHIYLYGTITNENVLKISKSIEKYNNIKKKMIIDINNNKNGNAFYIKTKPILIHINSPGGDAYAGIALTNVIRKSIVPITIVIEGMSASASTFISVMANKRVMMENAFMLIHQYSEKIMDNLTHEHIQYKLKTGDNLIADLYKIY